MICKVMSQLKSQILLTQGSVPLQMLRFAVPIFFSNLFQQLYNAADTLIVGNFLGSGALAAVGSSGSLIMLLVGFFNGMSMGAGVLIARYFGAGDEQSLSRAVHTTVLLGAASGALLSAVGVALTPQILRWMGTPPEVLPSSVAYFRMYFTGVWATVLYNVGAAILQAAGDSRSPMAYLITASVVNVALDLLFVGRLGFGIEGAAIATVLSQALSAALAFRRLLFGATPCRVRLSHLRTDPSMLRQVVALGAPSGVQNSVISLANVIVQANINAFGASAMAGCAAYSKVEGFAFLPVTCFSMALATFVSQNIGAKQFGRVRRGMRFGAACSALMAEAVGVAVWLFAPALLGAFSADPAVTAVGVAQARTISLFYCLLAYSHCCAGILRGMGRPVVPMAVMLLVWCAFRIGYITAAVRIWPCIRVVWTAYPLTWSISTVLFTLYLLRSPIPGEREHATIP